MKYRAGVFQFESRRAVRTALLFIYTVCILAGCASTEYFSRWTTEPPPSTPDGGTVWQGAMTKIEDGDLLIGLMNDSAYVYLSLVTDDRMIQNQILRTGFTVWFDRDGGSDHRFGFQYPLSSFTPNGFRGRGIPPDREFQPGSGRRGHGAFNDSTLEIYGPMPDAHERLDISALSDITVNISFYNGTLYYRAKIPFVDRGANPYAIGTKPGAQIGFGIVSGGGFNRGEHSGGGFIGGGGEDVISPEEGMGRRGGGARPARGEFKPLDLWMTVTLAFNK